MGKEGDVKLTEWIATTTSLICTALAVWDRIDKIRERRGKHRR